LWGGVFKVKGGGARGDLFASMPPLEAKKMLFRLTAGVRGWRRRRGMKEIKLMFIDVRKAHLNAKCEEEEWVELPEEMWKWGEVREVETMAVWNEEGGVWMGGRLRGEVQGGGI